MAVPVPLDNTLSLALGTVTRSSRVPPTSTLGVPGVAIYSGYVVEEDKDPRLLGRERYRTFSEALANCATVAAGVRYFLNLVAKTSWTFTPADHPDGEMRAEQIEQMLLKDPATSWPRIVRRAAMYRMYGFSVQEWTARKRPDGLVTLQDVAPRGQLTIERFDVDTTGRLLGVIQRSPQDSREIYLPRSKIVYMVDDSLSDGPTGLGVFRHIVSAVDRLKRYEQLEGFGFETDLRGIPIGRVPYAELDRLVTQGKISQADALKSARVMETFIERHIKTSNLGLVLDSETFTTTDGAQRPSNVYKFGVELLQGTGGTSQQEINVAIERINREIARVLGVEQILLGSGDRGSFALARDKSHQFSLTVDATLEELAAGFTKDLVETLFRLNGWDPEAMPTLSPEAAAYRDVDQITASLRDMAQAGAVIDPRDPAIDEVRALLGLSPVPEDLLDDMLDGGQLLTSMGATDAAPAPPSNNQVDPDGELPEEDEQ